MCEILAFSDFVYLLVFLICIITPFYSDHVSCERNTGLIYSSFLKLARDFTDHWVKLAMYIGPLEPQHYVVTRLVLYGDSVNGS